MCVFTGERSRERPSMPSTACCAPMILTIAVSNRRSEPRWLLSTSPWWGLSSTQPTIWTSLVCIHTSSGRHNLHTFNYMLDPLSSRHLVICLLDTCSTRRIKLWMSDRRANATFCNHDCARTQSGSADLVMGKNINDIINLLSFVFTL